MTLLLLGTFHYDIITSFKGIVRQIWSELKDFLNDVDLNYGGLLQLGC
jgi:hypothetical protein